MYASMMSAFGACAGSGWSFVISSPSRMKMRSSRPPASARRARYGTSRRQSDDQSLRDHQHLRGPAGLSGQPLDGRRLLVAETRLRVTLAEEAAPVDARPDQAEPPDVEPLATEILRRAGELHVVVERHASSEALRRHASTNLS